MLFVYSKFHPCVYPGLYITFYSFLVAVEESAEQTDVPSCSTERRHLESGRDKPERHSPNARKGFGYDEAGGDGVSVPNGKYGNVSTPSPVHKAHRSRLSKLNYRHDRTHPFPKGIHSCFSFVTALEFCRMTSHVLGHLKL